MDSFECVCVLMLIALMLCMRWFFTLDESEDLPFDNSPIRTRLEWLKLKAEKERENGQAKDQS